MAAISREVEMSYKGKTYDILINMALINKIESSGINVLQLAIDLESDGIPPMSLVSTLYAIMLNSAGANTTPDDVWVEVNKGGDNTSSVVANVRVLVVSMFPQPEGSDSKKDSPQES